MYSRPTRIQRNHPAPPSSPEAALQALEGSVQALRASLESKDPQQISLHTQRVQKDLQFVVSQCLPLARNKQLTPKHWQQLEALYEQIAIQREAVVRLNVGLSDAMQLLLPVPNDPTYKTRIEKHLPIPMTPRADDITINVMDF